MGPGGAAALTRGDVVLVAGGSGPAGKPRPCVIVQRTSTIDASGKVTVCPLTSGVRVGPPARPIVHPTADNRLKHVSEVEVDWLFTYRIDRIGPTIGRLDPHVMRAVDRALRRWLDL